MQTYLPIEQRITHYFLSMGAEPAESAEINPNEIRFRIGSESVVVVILKPTELTKRNAIFECILSLSSLREDNQLVYLAAPRLLGATIDSTMFRERGIGLLFFDERRIDETVTPGPSRLNAHPAATVQMNPLTTEVAELKSMYAEMERNLNELREDLKDFRNRPEPPHRSPQIAPPLSDSPLQDAFHPQARVQADGLPSYFADNPWLEVLSRRGVAEREPVAG